MIDSARYIHCCRLDQDSPLKSYRAAFLDLIHHYSSWMFLLITERNHISLDPQTPFFYSKRIAIVTF